MSPALQIPLTTGHRHPIGITPDARWVAVEITHPSTPDDPIVRRTRLTFLGWATVLQAVRQEPDTRGRHDDPPRYATTLALAVLDDEDRPRPVLLHDYLDRVDRTRRATWRLVSAAEVAPAPSPAAVSR